MAVSRGPNFQQVPLKMVTSSVFGLYDKMDSQKVYNFTQSDGFMVPYMGYKIGIGSSVFNDATTGRGFYESIKTNRIVGVFEDMVYLINLTYDHQSQNITYSEVSLIGQLGTSSGPVYIAENNKPQILISDGTSLYLYDSTLTQGTFSFTVNDSAASTNPNTLQITTSSTFGIGQSFTITVGMGGTIPTTSPQIVAGVTYYISNISYISDTEVVFQLARTILDAYNGTNVVTFTNAGTPPFTITTTGNFQIVKTNFTPGYISFHDTYFLCAASQDTFYEPSANNTWRLSGQNNGLVWGDTAAYIGLLETKPDNTQAVVRFPSQGNMILVMGKSVTEFWFDTGAQLFPYQRNDQMSIDYGCINPATIAFMDQIVIWLAINEKSGPIIMYSNGGPPTKITTDGIDYQFSQLQNPQDSQGFIFRKNGHIFYHINFYSDNLTYIVDLTANKIFNACDQDLNYYIMGQVVWFNNQYFGITKNNGNLFIFDTIFSTYQDVDNQGNVIDNEIPRIIVTDNIRLPTQDGFILNDVGFTIESGNSDYQLQNRGPIYFQSEDGKLFVSEGNKIKFKSEDGKTFISESGNIFIAQNTGTTQDYFISETPDLVNVTPRVDMSVSYDGGASFSSDFPYVLPHIGKRKNRLMWWQGGWSNDVVLQFKFWNFTSRVLFTDGVVNIRT